MSVKNNRSKLYRYLSSVQEKMSYQVKSRILQYNNIIYYYYNIGEDIKLLLA